MNENVTKFFELYAQDAGLRARVSEAEASYPGSLELREPLAEYVLAFPAAFLSLFRIFYPLPGSSMPKLSIALSFGTYGVPLSRISSSRAICLSVSISSVPHMLTR